MSTVQSQTMALPQSTLTLPTLTLPTLTLPSLTLPSSSTSLPPDNQRKAAFTPPKLMFLVPELTKQGSVDQLAAGIIGTFS